MPEKHWTGHRRPRRATLAMPCVHLDSAVPRPSRACDRSLRASRWWVVPSQRRCVMTRNIEQGESYETLGIRLVHRQPVVR